MLKGIIVELSAAVNFLANQETSVPQVRRSSTPVESAVSLSSDLSLSSIDLCAASEEAEGKAQKKTTKKEVTKKYRRGYETVQPSDLARYNSGK